MAFRSYSDQVIFKGEFWIPYDVCGFLNQLGIQEIVLESKSFELKKTLQTIPKHNVPYRDDSDIQFILQPKVQWVVWGEAYPKSCIRFWFHYLGVELWKFLIVQKFQILSFNSYRYFDLLLH